MTNGDKIRQMIDEELAEICVYAYGTLSYSDIAFGVQRIYGVVAGSEYAPLNMAELRGLLKGEPWANRLI